LTWSAKTYLKNVIEKVERIFGEHRTFTSPMDPDYHPELDETDFVEPDEISKY
jgi:hypothetical protein